jgi:hypothetical protein
MTNQLIVHQLHAEKTGWRAELMVHQLHAEKTGWDGLRPKFTHVGRLVGRLPCCEFAVHVKLEFEVAPVKA